MLAGYRPTADATVGDYLIWSAASQGVPLGKEQDDGTVMSDALLWMRTHDEAGNVVPDGEGGVSLNSVGPVVDVRLADLPITPATKAIVSIALRQPDGTYAAPTRYRVTDTQDDGYGGMKLLLVKGG